jgi:DNA-binding SARP family transcriptional activator/tetratricopeptide (TPR) repeat protein
MPVEFRLLGAIEVRDGGRVLDAGHARQRCVLAVLLMEANRMVPVDALVDRVWGEGRAPANPVAAVQTYVSLLRRALAGVEGVTINRQQPGYEVVVNAESVDVHRFRGLLARARAAGDDDRVAAFLEEALGLIRGEPFAGLDTPWITDVRAALLLEQRTARLDLNDIQLRRGHHAALLAGLAAQAAEHRLDERVAGQLMLALYRSGRQAEALAEYRQIRDRLAEELGADPGSSLQYLHHQMLTADPALARAEPAGASVQQLVVPRQLPARPRFFTGRAGELAALTAALAQGAGPGATMVISAIGGSGGIGKTWLALQWAHQQADRFPDGQLWVDLHGYDPTGVPLSPSASVRGLLDALGVDPASLPASLDAQVGLYRSLVVGKRMLVVLDNARDSGQVVPLLPGSPGCSVLVTSRRLLTGLVSAHGAHSVELDTLPDGEAWDLLAAHVGAERLSAEPAAAAALLTYCAGLPLAISVAAARAATHPTFPLALLADELREATTRLDALETADAAASVPAALSWSYHALDPTAARVFGLLGIAPGPSISLPAAASLTGLPLPRAQAVLRQLETVSMLDQHLPGRYRMHDLIRLYASEQARRDQPEEARTDALRRVTDFYLHTALAADHLISPYRPQITPEAPSPGCVPHRLTERAAALAWFDSEYLCLLAVQQLAAVQGWPTRTWQLAWALNSFQVFRGVHLHDRVTTWQVGLAAAEQLGQPEIRTLASRFLGHACAQFGLLAEAVRHLRHAITLAEQTGDIDSQAHSHLTLANTYEQQNDNRQALHHAVRSLRLFQSLGDPIWSAAALNSVGWCQAHLGMLGRARIACQAALALSRQHNDPEGEAATLDSLAFIALRAGDHAEAIGHYTEALALSRELGHTYGEADIQAGLAEAHAARGDHEQSRLAWLRALELYQAQHRTSDVVRVQRQLDSRNRSNGSATARAALK